jgi:Domain of unknown function (DUF4158)
VPVEFLSDAEAAAYGRYSGAPSQADLDRVFFLDDEDRALVDRRRGTHMRVGFALQLVTVRWLGTFLEEPLDVPGAVLDFLAGQLGVADPSLVKRYTERTKTRFDHQWEIRRAYGLREFVEIEAKFTDWVAARSWTSGDGSKAIFLDGMTWLRDRKVLLPGVTTLARLVARVRDDTTRRLWQQLERLLALCPGPVAGGPAGIAGVGSGAVAQGPIPARQRPGNHQGAGPGGGDHGAGAGRSGRRGAGAAAAAG